MRDDLPSRGRAPDGDGNHFSLIELGRNSPSLRTIFSLCDALDIAPSDLMKDIERRLRI